MPYRDRIFLRKVVLLVGDIALLFIALYGAMCLWYREVINFSLYSDRVIVFMPLFGLWIALFFAFGLYHVRVLKNIYWTLYSLLLGIFIASVGTAIMLYVLFESMIDFHETLFLFFIGSVTLLTALWRIVMYIVFARVAIERRVLLVGNGGVSQLFAPLVKARDGIEYRIIGSVTVNPGEQTSFLEHIPTLGYYTDLSHFVRTHRIDDIVISFDYRNHQEPVRHLSDSLSFGARVMDWPIFYEQVYHKVPTDKIDHFWFLSNIDESEKRGYERAKRVFDILIASLGLVILTILTPFVVLGITSTSRGPALYRQQRIGKGERIFTLIKFRTMVHDAEKDGARWASPDDERVTSFGRFLRRTRLDELPQFINIMRGEMSLVGPRPERPEFIPILKKAIPFYYKRSMVRPGITGFAQIMHPYAASVEDSLEKIGYDLYYIKNRSVRLYFHIALRTIRVIVSFRGR